MARKRLGELLVERRVITVSQLEEGLAHQRQHRMRLGAALVAKGLLSEGELVKALSLALEIPLVELRRVEPEWSAVHLLRARFCETHDLFPFALEQGRTRKLLAVAMSDPLNFPAIEEIEFTTGLKVSPHLAPLSEVRESILRWYHKIEPDSGTGMKVIPAGGEQGAGTARSRVVPEIDFDEEEVIVGEEIESTERTTLEALIARREQQRRQRRAAKGEQKPADGLAGDLDYLFGMREDTDEVAELERKFWALMRIMARKGLITREEFQSEVDSDEDEAAPPKKR